MPSRWCGGTGRRCRKKMSRMYTFCRTRLRSCEPDMQSWKCFSTRGVFQSGCWRVPLFLELRRNVAVFVHGMDNPRFIGKSIRSWVHTANFMSRFPTLRFGIVVEGSEKRELCNTRRRIPFLWSTWNAGNMRYTCIRAKLVTQIGLIAPAVRLDEPYS